MMKGSLLRNPEVRLGGDVIQRSMVTRYLGVHLDEKQNYAAHVNIVCERAVAMMQKIARLAQRQYKIPLAHVRSYLNTIVASIVNHAASAWAHRLNENVKIREKVDRIQRSLLLRMTGAFGTTSAHALTVAAGIMPLHLEVKRRAAMYWLRKQDHEKVQQLLATPCFSKREIKAAVLQQWQTLWSTSTKGRRLFQLMPNIEQRLELTHLLPTQGLIHFLTGHGPYPEHLRRMNLRDSGLCDCGAVGTPEHVVLECHLQEDELEEMRATLRGIPLREILQNAQLLPVLNNLANKVSKLQYTIFHEL